MTSSPAPKRHHRVRRLLGYLKPARWHFAGGVLAGLVYAAASGVGLPTMIYVVTPVIFGETVAAPAETKPEGSAFPCAAESNVTSDPAGTGGKSSSNLDKRAAAQQQLAEWSKRFFGPDYRDKLLLVACLAMPLVFLIRGLASFLNRYWLNHAGFQMLEAMRADVFRRLQDLPLEFYHRHKTGDLTARLMTDTEQLKGWVITMSGDILKQPFTLLGALGFLGYLAATNRSAVFVLITLASVPACILPIRLVARRIIKRARQLASQTGELNAVVIEGLQSPMEIQAYNLQPRLLERFRLNIRNIFRLSMKTVKYQAFVAPLIEFVSACGFMAALYFGVRNGMDFATFSAMGLALFTAYDPVKKLSALSALWKMSVAALERLEHVLEAEDTVPAPAQPQALPPGAVEIRLENVGFTYAARAGDTQAPIALREINARFQPGEAVALVGPSGAGKSTFVSLLPRFYDPTTGRVTLGGVDLRNADKTALRERIALVPQTPALFNASIAENIRVGRLSATDAEVRAAAEKAFVADFINTLPQGYETIVGERGTSLSGGQRQRIAIARAFLKDAPILILDEATSALDSESEAKVQLALRELVRGRTTFMIAHRFSSISLATRILVFEAGQITGDGTPDELRRNHPAFRRMVELQLLDAPATPG